MKPCINCSKECEIYQIQLRDFFSLKYLRLCSTECLFELAWDFLYEKYLHKDFDNSLHDKQLPEDLEQRNKDVDECMQKSLELMAKSFQNNPGLLTTPMFSLNSIFSTETIGSLSTGQIVKFQKYKISVHDRIKSQESYIEDLEEKLKIAREELISIGKEMQ